MPLILAGVCQTCRCTEDNACRLGCGDTCSWYDRTRTVCTNPHCVSAYEAKRAAAAAASRPRKLQPYQVEELRRSERNERRRKARKRRAA